MTRPAAEGQGEGAALLHIASEAEWTAAQAAGELRPPSLEAEGFVHCSWTQQVAATADRHFPGRDDLVLLELDREALDAPLVVEDSYGSGQAYPHVYGPVPLAAVIRSLPFPRTENGPFAVPADLA
ncbi:MAG: uncharacterized protein JWM05_3183 [Acidimicrobiales bacterium]|nr:uncharacterized protein [Acidimicrobiales bacterium]